MASLAVRIERARRAYLAHPGRSTLRAYLVLKARTGRWDARYCKYYGVPSSGLTGWVHAFLTRGVAAGLVPTSTTNGTHAPGSYHSTGHAGDLGLPATLVGTMRGRQRMEKFQSSEFALRRKLGHTELIGPVNNKVVLRGQPTSLAEGTALENQHDGHVHGAKA